MSLYLYVVFLPGAALGLITTFVLCVLNSVGIDDETVNKITVPMYVISILSLIAGLIVLIIFYRNKTIDSSVITTYKIDCLYKQDDKVYLRTSAGTEYILANFCSDKTFQINTNDDNFSNIFVLKQDKTYKWKIFYSEEETLIHVAYVDGETYNDIMNIEEYNIGD